MSIASATRRVAELLEETGCKVVFAESCTGGLVSGALTAIAGISRFHCGGMVVYRNETKVAYLDIPRLVLDDPGPVSRKMTQLLAERVLVKTPEANLAVAVTGHLGPQAPPLLDGQAYAAIAWRGVAVPGRAVPGRAVTGRAGRGGANRRLSERRFDCQQYPSRIKRLRLIVGGVLDFVADELEEIEPLADSRR